MAEFEDRLNAILGDPEAMGQIVSIAKALTGEGGPAAAPAEGQAPEEPPVGEGDPAGESPKIEGVGALGPLLQLLGGMGENPLSALGELDPKLIQTAVTLFSQYSAGDNEKTALLNALRPFLKEERRAKVDKAVRIARLSRVIRVAFQLFKGTEGEGLHV